MYSLRQLTQPAYEPVSLAEAKTWALVDDGDTSHDTTLQSLIKAMRERAENLTFRAYVPRQYRLTMDQWPYDRDYGVKFCLPFPPLLTLDSFKYMDLNGTMQDMVAADYQAMNQYEPALVVPAYLAVWPVSRIRPDALQLVFTAGYAPGSPDNEAGYQAALPESLRLWMKARISTLFDNRDTLVVGSTVTPLPYSHIDGMLDSLTVGTRLF